MTSEIYAVVGATGQQGAAATRALLARGANVRALVRDPEKPAARALRDLGADLWRADLDSPSSVVTALEGVTSAFAMTTYSDDRGVAGEVEHGRNLTDAAATAGLPRLVYSSVGGVERNTGIPHFESKREVELYMLDRLSVAFVRPTFFMENLTRAAADTDDAEIVVRFPLAGDIPLQMVSVRDIGEIGAALVLDPAIISTEGIEIAGDELTMNDVADAIGRHRGKPARFEELPLSAFGDDEDRTAMFRWFAKIPAYQADVVATRRIDPTTLSFRDWLAAGV